ncbi:hypothetical protein [Bacteroides sp. Marseille-P3684]|uniref:hypothetical protein n=1 Tax=Bacteroides sp. Marseille-P3684 TaxID=2086579 RepID=UPI000D114878|nr:hypothetical protein [Bacteroides sp. Marseille-P3684]
MTESEKNIILDFVSSKIPLDDFYQKMPQYKNEDYIIKNYNEIISNRDCDALCYLRLVPIRNIKSFENVYKKLLLEDWHIEHEDIVGSFQWHFNKNVANISLLLEALIKIPKYLQEDVVTKYSYIKKIIYAIGAQPQPESLSALEKLAAETSDEKIKELALHQLEKRKRLGRWEQKTNK